MRTIAHISDLHFGAESAVLADALRKQLLARPPSLLVISGDLTQRARRRQYQAARAYLDTLPIPQIVVPGNHDIPLYDVVRRFFFPLRRYRHYLSRDVSPVFEDEEIFVAGINTARSLTWKSGRISPDQIEALKKRLNATRAPVRIVVTHHPFIPPPAGSHEARIDLVGRAVEALQVLEEQHVDLLLAGHLHHGYSGDTRTYYPTTRRSILSIQAGTAISRRVRPSDRNGFNLITLDRNSARVEVQSWVKDEFISLPPHIYLRSDRGWHPQSSEDQPAK